MNHNLISLVIGKSGSLVVPNIYHYNNGKYYAKYLGKLIIDEYLMNAVSIGNYHFTEIFLFGGANIYYKNNKILKTVCRIKSINILKLIYSYNSDIFFGNNKLLKIVCQNYSDSDSYNDNELIIFLSENDKKMSFLQRSMHLVIFCQNGNKKMVEYLYKYYCSGNDKFIYHGFIAAISNNHIDIVRFLYENFTSIDLININESLSLYKASIYGHIDLVRYLYEKGATFTDANLMVFNVPEKICRHNYYEICKFYVEHGSNVMINIGLEMAAKYGRIEILKYIYQYGGNTVVDKITPIILACKYGQIDIVKYLLDINSKINMKENNEIIIEACRNGYSEIVKYLLTKGFNIKADEGYLMYYAVKNNDLELAKYLWNNGLFPLTQEILSLSLMEASEYGNLELIQFLESIGGELKDKKLMTNAMISLTNEKNNDRDIVSYLEKKGVKICKKDIQYIINHACKYGKISTLKILHERNYVFGSLGIGKACSRGHISIVKFLIDINFKNGFNENFRVSLVYGALEACIGGHLEILKYIDEFNDYLNIDYSDDQQHVKWIIVGGNIDLLIYLQNKYGSIIRISSDNVKSAIKCNLKNFLKYFETIGVNIVKSKYYQYALNHNAKKIIKFYKKYYLQLVIESN